MTIGTPAPIAALNEVTDGASVVVIVSVTLALKSVLPRTRQGRGSAWPTVATPARLHALDEGGARAGR